MKVDPKTEARLLILEHLRAIEVPESELFAEVKFHKSRDWRFDFALPRWRIAFEYEGIFANRKGQSGKSRHLTPTGFSDDCEKYTWAAILGWITVRITPSMIQDGRAGPLIRNAINSRLIPSWSDPYDRLLEEERKKT
jgi:hypothetical protein